MLGCWDVPWTPRAGSTAGLEPGIGKSGAGARVLSLWGCWGLSSLASADQLSVSGRTWEKEAIPPQF